MKKTFVLLLALCMAAVLFAVPVFAEGDGNAQPVDTQQALEQALAAAAAAPAGGTVTLEGNITLTAPITVPAKVTLDGARYTLTADTDFNGSYVVLATGNLSNVTVNAAGMANYAVQVYGETANVTLTNVAMQNGKYSGLVVNNGASASLKGCTFAGNGFSAVELADGKDHSGAAPKLTVDSLTDEVTVRADVSANAQPVLTVEDGNPVLRQSERADRVCQQQRGNACGAVQHAGRNRNCAWRQH